MRLLMMGTGPFAVPTFEALLATEHEIVALITRPSPPAKGRGPAPANPMRNAAERHSLPVHAPDSINSPEAQQLLQSLAVDLFVVCDYGQILKNATLALAPLGGINLHGSLLPKYRGAAPINWAVWNGETETGVTVIHMTPKLDGGPILAIRSTPIGLDEITPELEGRLSQLGIAPVLESLALLATWDRHSPLGVLQDQTLASAAPRLKKTDAAVDWTRTAEQIHNQVRAFKPWPGTFTQLLRPPAEPLRLILDQVRVVSSAPSSPPPGTIVQSDGQSLHVAAGGGTLALERIQPAGKRVLEIAEFLRGYHVRVGEQLN